MVPCPVPGRSQDRQSQDSLQDDGHGATLAICGVNSEIELVISTQSVVFRCVTGPCHCLLYRLMATGGTAACHAVSDSEDVANGCVVRRPAMRGFEHHSKSGVVFALPYFNGRHAACGYAIF